MKKPIVLLTGATGILGSACLASILRQRLRLDLVVLVRAGSDAEAVERIRAAAERHGLEIGANLRGEAGAGTRLIVLSGDLDSVSGSPALAEVTHVLHLAANTSFLSDERIVQTNVGGTRSLARGLAKSKSLRRFLYVGTAAICGDAPPRVVGEKDYPDSSVRHIVQYSVSKALAETMLREEFPRLPLVVARPSIVVGDTQRGCRPSGSLYWLFRAVDRLGVMTWREDSRLDVVPGDWVAGALVTLLLKDHLSHDLYHVSAGPGASSWRDIEAAFREEEGVVRLTQSGFYRTISRQELLRVDTSPITSAPAEKKRLLRALTLYFRFAELDVVFDNSRLMGEGITAPAPFHAYLGKCERTSPRSLVEQMNEE